MLPTLAGPFATAVVIVSLSLALGKHDPLLGGPFMNWLIGVVVFGLLALVLGAAMLGVDLLFAAFGRRPIDGACAWIAGLLAPLPVGASWLFAPPRHEQGPMFFVALLAPIVVSAGLVRLIALWACGRYLGPPDFGSAPAVTGGAGAAVERLAHVRGGSPARLRPAGLVGVEQAEDAAHPAQRDGAIGGDVLLLARVGELVVELHAPGALVDEAVALHLEAARDLAVDGERGARGGADLVEGERGEAGPLDRRAARLMPARSSSVA